MTENTAPPVVVIGAGIVGVASALRLQQNGMKVLLVDRQPPGEGASFGNGGILAGASVVPVPTPGLAVKAPGMLLQKHGPLYLKWSYIPRLMPWLLDYLSNGNAEKVQYIARHLTPLVQGSLEEHQDLARGTKAERRIETRPFLFVYRDRAAYEGDAFGWGLRRDNGFEFSEIDGGALLETEPVLSADYKFGVMLEKHHGTVNDPGQYVKDLVDAFVSRGGEFRQIDVRDIRIAGNQAEAVITVEGEIACASVVLAMGAWSGPLARKLGLKVPLESERGYHLEIDDPSVLPKNALMCTEGKFVLTPMGDKLRLAGLVEFGGLEAPPSAKPIAALKHHVARLMPGLRYSKCTEWMGHRPAPSDSLPLLGPAPRCPNVFLAFGHHHVGLTAGPKTGRLIGDMVAGRGTNLDLSPYRPERFG